jgi:hypothetical protein
MLANGASESIFGRVGLRRPAQFLHPVAAVGFSRAEPSIEIVTRGSWGVSGRGRYLLGYEIRAAPYFRAEKT